jgi:ABC-type uncharacterized transport system auxiliary subunit
MIMKKIYVKQKFKILFLLIGSFIAVICNAQTGTADGTYNFAPLGGDNSGGTGFKTAGDKLYISNICQDGGGAAYLNSTDGETFEFKAEGGSTMKQATVVNLAIGLYGGESYLTQFDITLKDAGGTTVGVHTFAGNKLIDAADGDINISTILFSTTSPSSAWPAGGHDNVASMIITYKIDRSHSNFEIRNIQLANISNVVSGSNTAPTAASFTVSPIYENTTYFFSTVNFSYSDADGDPIDHLRVTAIPANGTLYVDANASDTYNVGEQLSNGNTVSKANLDAGNLQYYNTNGTSSSFTFDVNDGTDYSASTYTTTLTVTPEPTVTLSLDPFSSISENGGSTSVKATLSHSFNRTVTANLSKTGTTAGSDYSISSASISITAGNFTGTAILTGQDDDLDENNETIIIDISAVTNGTESGTQQVTCTLTDDDNTPVITASQTFDVDENAADNASVGTVLATDADAGTSFSSWTITAGNDDGIFTINTSTGAITVFDKTNLDYETTTSYTLSITVSDGLNTSASADVIISINAINDNTPVITASQTFNVDENAADNASVGTVLATDADAGTSFSSWTITAGNDDGIFAINTSTGAITVFDKTNLDYETTTSYTLSITVSDGLNTSASADVTITVNPINDNTPVITASQTFNVDENAADNASVGTVLATDADAGTSFSSWTITAGNDDGIFAINTSTGAITVFDKTNLDYETTTSFTLSLTVSDGTNTSASVDVAITINPINDNTPVITASQTFDVDENAADNTSVGAVLATDADAGTSFSNWTITVGNDDGVFAINTSTGAITVFDKTNLDYETTTSFTLSLTVSDGLNTSASADVTIDINPINDNTPVITASQTFDVDENAADNASVGTVLASDGDAGTSFSSWTITAGNDDGIFAINTSTGAITVADKTNLDYETTTSYTLSLTVSDGTNTSAVRTLIINITDINDVKPLITSHEPIEIAVNIDNGTVVGMLQATDGDVSETTFQQWTIVSGNINTDADANDAIALDASIGELSILDAEDLVENTEITLVISVSDGLNTSASADVTITVNPINDNTPVITASQTFNVDENAADNASVGTVLATDADAGTSFSSWTITAGNDDGIFAINTSTGAITVFDKTNLDYETTTSYTLSLTVSDGTNTSASADVAITINPINDNTPIITASQTFDVDENAADNASVGTVLATDADAGTSFSSWTITAGNDDGIFAINTSTGAITVADKTNLDYETTISYTLSLTVSDGTNTSAVGTLIINITDINDVKPLITSHEPIEIAVNIDNGTVVGMLQATDGDVSETTFQQWTIVSGNINTDADANDAIALDASIGELSILDAEDLVENTEITLVISVSDGLNTSASADVTITVNPINDNTPVITASQTFNVDENAADNASVGTVLATDADAGTSFSSWTITAGNDDGIFAINTSTGAITVFDKTNLDYETTTSYTLSLTVSDGLNTSASADVTIDINPINDNTPVVTASQSFNVDENAADNTSVGAVLATDADAGTSFSNWTITAGNDDGIFAINTSTGAITVFDKTNLDYETTTSYTLSLTVSDGLNTSALETITINITDVNDSAPTVTTDAASEVEVTTATLNGTVNANDYSTTITFEYGLTTAYGNTIAADQSPVSGATDTDVSVNLTDLSPNTTYHFRVKGESDGGSAAGSDLSFTTNKYSQTITFDALADKTTNDDDFAPGATSNLGLEISYSSNNEQVATIVDNQIHIIGAGTTSIIASQLGNDTVFAATPVEQSLTITQATGIDDLKSLGIKFYPNPTADILTIEIVENYFSDKIEVSIIDLKGSVIYSSTLTRSLWKINVSDYPQGLYIIRIRNQNRITNHKLLIE